MNRMMYRIMNHQDADVDYWLCEECLEKMREEEEVIDRVPDIVCNAECGICGYDIMEEDEDWLDDEDDNTMAAS